ncbi:MAG: hypothetical protein ACP5SH_10765, partial [Syntrophobacteraceae bacterium]
PEVRGVMDRMLATDEQIEVARQQSRLGSLFKDAKQAGMTSAEWRAYNGLVKKAVDEARSQVQKKAMAALVKERSDEWRQKAEELRPEVEQEVNARKDIQALYYLRNGKMLGEEDAGNLPPVRLDRQALVRLVGEDNLRELPSNLIKNEGGADPQLVAEMFGYRSAFDMLTDLFGLEAQRRDLAAKGVKVGSEDGFRQHLIQDALTARLRQYFGDPATDGTLPEEAQNAVHNERSMQVLATELRALIRQSGKERAVFGPVADARSWARETIGNRKIWEVTNLNRYARDESRAAMAAEKAMVDGDLSGAIAAKRQQILNHALYMEAKKAAESLEGLEDRANRYAKVRTIKSMDQGALDQIHTLLERFGLKRPDPHAAQTREVLSNWVQRIREDYGDVFVPDSLFNPNLTQHYKDLTVSQVRDLSDAVKSIAHVGRDMQKIRVGGTKADLAATIADMVRSGYANIERKELPKERNPLVVQGDFEQRMRARGRIAKDFFGRGHASMAKLEQEVIDRFDGGDSNGIWNRVIWRPIKDSTAYFNKWMDQMSEGINDLRKVYTKENQDRLGQMLEIKELTDNQTGGPLTISRAELLSFALNWGNESNRSKMCRGEGWDPEVVQQVFDKYMEKADWDFVQGIWDLMEKLRPEIEAKSIRVTGIAPEWIKPAPVVTPYGEYRGGYYPMAYDPTRSGDVMERRLSQDALMNDQGRAGRPVIYRGHEISRIEAYARPVRLSLDVIPQHFDDVIHNLAWGETTSDLCRVLKSQPIRDLFKTTIGDNLYNQLIPMLKRTVGDRTYDRTGNEFWEKVARGARMHVTMMGLGYRISTMLVHGSTALSNSIGEIGRKWTLRGFKDFYGDPGDMAKMRDFVFERSSEMAHRLDTFDRDIRDAMKKVQGQGGGIIDGAKRFAYHGIAWLDMASALPTWLGAYDKALAPEAKGGLGMENETDAIYYADKAVRNAHGSGNPEDIAAVQAGGEFQKLTTMFYSFWNHFYNRQVDIARRGYEAVREGNVEDFAAVLARSWWYFIMPTILHAVIKGQGPSEDEGWLKWMAEEVGLGLFSGIPLARDAANTFQGHEYRVTPVSDIFTAAWNAYKDTGKWWNDEPVQPSRFLRHALDTAGYSFGLPLGQADQSLQYLWDYWNGDQNPEDVAQFMRYLVMGARPKK